MRADTVEGAAAAIVRACFEKPRTVSTSRLSALELWAARRFPRATAAAIARRVRQWKREHAAPAFVRYPDDTTWGG